MERNYYNKIARDYDLKRRKPWKALNDFLNDLALKKYDINGICLDLGCANGRNFPILKNENNQLIGIDNSIEFIKIARENIIDNIFCPNDCVSKIFLIQGDIQHLPIRKDTINNAFAIATIHHIRNRDKRNKVIKEIHDLLKIKGNLLITVWRKWQEKYKQYFLGDRTKRRFDLNYSTQQNDLGLKEHGDKFIPWTISSENITIQRFYHFFSSQEIKNALRNYELNEFKLMGGSTDRDNFFILAQKD